MAKYLVEGSYTADGLSGLMKDKASGRKAAVQAAFKSAKAKLEGFYFGPNGADFIMIVEAPDSISVASISITAMASGAADLRVTPLLSVADIDAALATTPKYRAPGE